MLRSMVDRYDISEEPAAPIFGVQAVSHNSYA
jgi:hypothetical protein